MCVARKDWQLGLGSILGLKLIKLKFRPPKNYFLILTLKKNFLARLLFSFIFFITPCFYFTKVKHIFFKEYIFMHIESNSTM